MIDKTLAAVFVLLGALSAQGSIRVEYRASKMHGLIDFVLAVSGDPYHAPVFAEIFSNSKFNDGPRQKKLKQLDSLKTSLNRTLSYKSSVPSRRMGTKILNLIITQSLFSNTLKDLSQRTLGLLSTQDHQKFFEILGDFEPIYDQLVWKNNLEELLEHQRKLEELAKKVNLNEMFKVAEIFYRASWPEDVPFTVGLYPVPFLKGVPHTPVSLSLGSVEVHGVLAGSKKIDVITSLAGIFHEICHSLYDGQSDSYMAELEASFRSSRSPYRQHAYQWINEALATAIGNGWAFEKANGGKLDEADWYNHPTVNGFAKAIYPLTQKYLKEKRSIDANFVSQSISIYSKKYPDSISTFENVLTNLTLAHNSSVLKGSAAKSLLERSFFISNYSINSSLSTDSAMQSFRSHPSAAVLVFSEKDTVAFKNFANGIPFLKKNLGTLSKMKNRSFFASMDKESKAYIVIKVGSEAEYRAAIEKMREQKTFDFRKPIVQF